MRVFLCTCATVCALVGSGARVVAQEMPIEPDRPDLTNGAHLVLPGQIQFEIGGLHTRKSAAQSEVATPIGIRVGIRDWLEVRANLDGLITATEGDGRVTGTGALQLGAKVRVWPDADGRALFSVSPSVTLPTASRERGLGSGRSDYVLGALSGFDVGPAAHLDVNYFIGAIAADEGDHFAQHIASASLSVAVGERWNPYYEMFTISRDTPDGDVIVAINTGAIYMAAPRLALDGGVQVGLTEDASAFSVFGGVSFTLGGKSAGRRQPSSTSRKAVDGESRWSRW